MPTQIGGGEDPVFLEKRCPKCNLSKPLADWPRNRARSDGLGSYCRACKKVYDHNNLRQDPERWAHRIAYNREHKARDPEKWRLYNQQWRQNNVERCTEYTRRWRAKNPEKVNAISSKRRARLRGVTVEEVDFTEILLRDGLWCYLCECEVEPDQLEFDHVRPLSRGGEHSRENIKVAHQHCNRKKNSRTAEEYRACLHK